MEKETRNRTMTARRRSLEHIQEIMDKHVSRFSRYKKGDEVSYNGIEFKVDKQVLFTIRREKANCVVVDFAVGVVQPGLVERLINEKFLKRVTKEKGKDD